MPQGCLCPASASWRSLWHSAFFGRSTSFALAFLRTSCGPVPCLTSYYRSSRRGRLCTYRSFGSCLRTSLVAGPSRSTVFTGTCYTLVACWQCVVIKKKQRKKKRGKRGAASQMKGILCSRDVAKYPKVHRDFSARYGQDACAYSTRELLCHDMLAYHDEDVSVG